MDAGCFFNLLPPKTQAMVMELTAAAAAGAAQWQLEGVLQGRNILVFPSMGELLNLWLYRNTCGELMRSSELFLSLVKGK